jgi:multiple sugar transport system permease protein
VSDAAIRRPDQAVPRGTVWSRLSRHVTGWLFALPWLIIFAVFLLIPIVASLALSFTSFGLGNLRDWFSADFVGLDNYSKLLSDERFHKAARNTAVFVVVGVPLTIAFGLAAALGLNQGIGKLQSVFRVGYYLPVVTSIVAIAVIWRYLLNADFGLVNAALGLVGIEGPNWLGQKSTALASIIALGIWRNFGFDTVIFLAALQGINPVLYEAAKVDGATPWAMFWRVTLPLLRPTILFLAVITSVGYLQLFEEPFVMTGGGPLDSTLSVAMYVYEQGFRFLNLGYASAVAYALFIAIVALTFIQFRFLRGDEGA